MLLISDKGNTNGPNILSQNTPDYIDSTINLGYNVKIDLWYHNDKCFLGDDGPKTEINWDWIIKNSSYLWINCRTTNTFSFLLENAKSLNFFYNKSDVIAMTSQGLAWSSADNPHTKGTITQDADQIDGVLGICSNHVSKWSRQIAVCFYGDTGLPKKSIIKNHKTNLVDRLEDMGYHLEYYGSKILDIKNNDHKYNKIYSFKGLKSHLKNEEKSESDMEEKHIESIYEMIGSHPYETAFFIRWDQTITDKEIIEHIKNI